MNLDERLHMENLAWRGFMILLLVIFIGVVVLSFIFDQRQHASDNKERAAAWTKIEDGIAANAIAIHQVDDHLQQCSHCHSHPPVISYPVKSPSTPGKKP